MKIIRVGVNYQFSIFSIVVYLFFLILLISLGFWQLGRADEKRALLAKEQQAGDEKVIKFLSINDAEDSEISRYRQIELIGQYDTEHQFLIDNQIVDGQVGYFVLTPFKLEGNNRVVLVNRGWVALNKNRSILPDVSIAGKQKINLIGRTNHFPSVGIRLSGAEIPTDGWPSVVQVVDVNVLSMRLSYPLFPFQIELDANMSDGYKRNWKMTSSVMPPEKHIAYAVQWFVLAITLTLMFIGISRNKHERTK